MSRPSLEEILDDLAAEESALDDIVAPLADAVWRTATLAEGWDVRDQIAHLAEGEELAALAAADAGAFHAELARLIADLAATEERLLRRGRDAAPAGLLARWRDARAQTLRALRGREASERIPWVVGDMAAASFATARLMETFAHGQDVVDGLGVPREATARLRHIAHLGVRTRGFSYRNRGLPEPTDAVRVALDAPGGGRWTWGPEDAPSCVTGPAIDFCLVVVQRRHVDDTGLLLEGEPAREWMLIAQAFAGPPGPGRPAGMFRRR